MRFRESYFYTEMQRVLGNHGSTMSQIGLYLDMACAVIFAQAENSFVIGVGGGPCSLDLSNQILREGH